MEIHTHKKVLVFKKGFWRPFTQKSYPNTSSALSMAPPAQTSLLPGCETAPDDGPAGSTHLHIQGVAPPTCQVLEMPPAGSVDPAADWPKRGDERGRGSSSSQVALGTLATAPAIILHDG